MAKNENNKLLIVGAGGMARETLQIVLDINSIEPRWKFIGFLVTGDYEAPKMLHGFPVFRYPEEINDLSGMHLSIAVGDTFQRRNIASTLKPSGASWATIIHPQTSIGDRVQIGEGTLICPGARITTDIKIGEHVIINLNCSISHDSVIEDYVTIGPGGNISGGVYIETGVEFGSSVALIPKTRVGSWSLLGAGSVVISNIPPNITAVGCPARVIKARTPSARDKTK